MVEIWKDIAGYENLYQVSNLGRVRSLDMYVNHWRGGKVLRKGRELNQCADGRGYNIVSLCKNKEKKTWRVHRLVAQAFIPNPDNLPCINHKDENKLNNCVDNLEWCDHKYNNNYGTRNERLSKPVLQYTKDGKFIAEYPSIHEAERNTNIDDGSISRCCNGKYKHTGGFKWRYKENGGD